MPEIKLIAMDMDGTLLGKERGALPPENLKALREAHRRGIHLALASGRAPDDLGFFAADADLPMHILATNGCVLCDGPLGRVSVNRCMAEATARAIEPLLFSSGIPYAAFCCHDILTVTPPAIVKASHVFVWGTFTTREGGRTRLITDRAAAEDLLHRVNKFVLAGDGMREPLVRLGEDIAARFPDVEVYFSAYETLEIMPRGVDKGSALTELAGQLNIPMAQVMALGDNENDIPMLKAAGYGVAMGNALPAVKEIADYVTLPCLEDGVAAAIRALALGENIPGVEKIR